MLINMTKNRLLIRILCALFIFFNFFTLGHTEIMILEDCKNLRDSFIKNEYILDLEKLLMTRNYIYDGKTYKKYRITDLSIKKKNSIVRFIYKEDNLFLLIKLDILNFILN